MNSSKVCAIVVSFHPQSQDLENLARIRPQVEILVVVDNGSNEEELVGLRSASRAFDVTLIENGRNLGLAAALNVGMRRSAAIEGVGFLILFDQDSVVPPDYVRAMVDCYVNHPLKGKIGILAPLYIDPKTDKPHIAPSPYIPGVGLQATWTSGSMISMESYKRYGGFEEALVMDMLDFEFSLRVRVAGSFIERCNEAHLLHSPGHPRVFHLWGRKLFSVENHNPARTYYRVRNRVWIARKYRGLMPGIARANLRHQVKDTVRMLLGEKQKMKKLKYTVLGLIDGLAGRMGYRVDL